jgi:hypothetical protein
MLPLLARIRNILLDPRAEWPLIATEPGNPWPRLGIYVAVLAAIPAIAGFFGSTYVGVTVSAGTFHDPLHVGTIKALISYAFSFAIVGLVALATDLLAPLFGARRNFVNALKLTAYSFTPVWLVGIILVFPGLRFLSILGLYAIRLLWTGLPPLMGSPRNGVLRYAISVAIAAIAIVFAMALVQAAITAFLLGR